MDTVHPRLYRLVLCLPDGEIRLAGEDGPRLLQTTSPDEAQEWADAFAQRGIRAWVSDATSADANLAAAIAAIDRQTAIARHSIAALVDRLLETEPAPVRPRITEIETAIRQRRLVAVPA